jgi:hypothetical protein
MAKLFNLAFNILCTGERPPTATEIAAELRAHADALEGKLKAEKTKKAAKPAKEEDEDDAEDESDSDAEDGEDADDSDDADGDSESDGDGEDAAEDGDDDSSEDDSESDDEDAPTKKDALAALKSAATRTNKKKAMATLLKVTGKESIHDVKPAKFAALIKALKVLKK